MLKIKLRKIDWDKIERFALYISLFILVIYNTILTIFPSVEKYIPNPSKEIILSTCFILSIHYLIKIIESAKESDDFVKHGTFTEGFHELFNNEKKISEISIVAYTSSTWFEHIRLLRNVKIKNLRILLFYDDDFLSKNIDENISTTKFRIERMQKSWNRLVEDDKIGSCEIRQIKMIAPIYFGIINRNKGLFGYLWPRKKISGLEPRESVIFYSSSNASNTMLIHSKAWFESMWDIADRIS